MGKFVGQDPLRFAAEDRLKLRDSMKRRGPVQSPNFRTQVVRHSSHGGDRARARVRARQVVRRAKSKTSLA